MRVKIEEIKEHISKTSIAYCQAQPSEGHCEDRAEYIVTLEGFSNPLYLCEKHYAELKDQSEKSEELGFQF